MIIQEFVKTNIAGMKLYKLTVVKRPKSAFQNKESL